MRRIAFALLFAGCAHPHAAPAPAPVAVVDPPSPACAAPEYRQFDFWDGDWDVTVHARASIDSDQWGDAKGTQHVDSLLGGCVTAEHFAADGPGTPWRGLSYSSWQPQLGKWRQTWVDDSGGYLAFTGGLEDGAMTLYGEPRTVKGVSFQMRMRYSDVTADSLHWEWQRSDDGGQTWKPLMMIDYARRPG
jgi:hypothetical protein